jgi:hypothetical protein
MCVVTLYADSTHAASRVERIMRDVRHSLCRSLAIGNCKQKVVESKRTTAQNGAAKEPMVKPKAKPRRVVKRSLPKLKRTITELVPVIPIPKEKPILTGTTEPAPPEPRDKPEKGDMLALPASLRKSAAAPPPGNPTLMSDTAAGSVCRLQLDTLGAVFETMKDSRTSGDCRVENPVRLSALRKADSRIEFPDGPILKCEFAMKFAEWLVDAGAPIVRAQAKSPIAKLWTGPGYQCRGRNGDASGKVSEHGFGNAVDITNFKLEDGRVFEVKDAAKPSSPAYATLKGLRGSACGYFTTVLGPGTNSAHETHFYLDLGKHGQTDNYKICQ